MSAVALRAPVDAHAGISILAGAVVVRVAVLAGKVSALHPGAVLLAPFAAPLVLLSASWWGDREGAGRRGVRRARGPRGCFAGLECQRSQEFHLVDLSRVHVGDEIADRALPLVEGLTEAPAELVVEGQD